MTLEAQEARITQELREIHDMLINLGLGIKRVHDDGRINRIRVDTNGQPNHQHGLEIQRMQSVYKDESNEEGIMDYYRTKQRRDVGAAQPRHLN